MLKATKIILSCATLILCVYSFFNQSEFLLSFLQFLLVLLLVLAGVESLINNHKWPGYIMFGSATFVLVVNVVKYMV
ncbi:hypothetical protein P4T89_12925 [Bacillus nakamurai]|uniref:DUF3953 domain-containing protein n=1 Tax=Bacillus nakamurai TaxID=1793963 RepID=A0A150FAM2_9BACI|nr:hypothetical protein [Bacillus nakamurai]KXZ22359.1 hypothetical protein AXI58_10230 [Bacillus nakamurai]MED1228419.1 hypothetical protein [Bacillus nakamurai]